MPRFRFLLLATLVLGAAAVHFSRDEVVFPDWHFWGLSLLCGVAVAYQAKTSPNTLRGFTAVLWVPVLSGLVAWHAVIVVHAFAILHPESSALQTLVAMKWIWGSIFGLLLLAIFWKRLR